MCRRRRTQLLRCGCGLLSPQSNMPSRASGAPASEEEEATAWAKYAKCTRWDLGCAVPKWAPKPAPCGPLSAAAAAALELESTKAMRKLRRRLQQLCEGHGLKTELPAATLESWRWSAKHEEESASGSAGPGKAKAKPRSGQHAYHPVLPRYPAPEADCQLARELTRHGLQAPAAEATVRDLRQTSEASAKEIVAKAHQTLSGMPLAAPSLEVQYNKRTVDLIAGPSHVKLSRQAYGKLAILHRQHAPDSEVTAAPPAATVEAVQSSGGQAEDAEAVFASGGGSGGGGDGDRLQLHLRIFTALLRYKTLHCAFHQAAIGERHAAGPAASPPARCVSSPHAHVRRWPRWPTPDGPAARIALRTPQASPYGPCFAPRSTWRARALRRR